MVDLASRDPRRHERLVEDLAGGLEPVRPLPGPAARAALWLGAALLFGLVLATRIDATGFMLRMRVPDLALAAAGAVLTAAFAAFAAFATSVPGRPTAWALLPLPPLALWVCASGLGCLRGWVAPGTDIPNAHEVTGCFSFLVCVSVPLSVLIVMMLRRACPLRPNLTAALGGLAAAAAAAALLMPFHPHDATATDLLIHAVAVVGVIGLNGLAGGRLLDRQAATG
ncbi:NrsF family protein [Methylobacterium sp. NEAU K]|uniref:NrsF family protein n=1 Tax=Methylobacterium sp. NEAU K TaxID=3064946 RepID=UPI002732C5BB|nr:NrsF family protein [Methylobacterium sp. NEAU K]MDP4004057.1 NrsF family protein [Methylobacterium sp. NEAU K]